MCQGAIFALDSGFSLGLFSGNNEASNNGSNMMHESSLARLYRRLDDVPRYGPEWRQITTEIAYLRLREQWDNTRKEAHIAWLNGEWNFKRDGEWR